MKKSTIKKSTRITKVCPICGSLFKGNLISGSVIAFHCGTKIVTNTGYILISGVSCNLIKELRTNQTELFPKFHIKKNKSVK